jgi:hypothetical protein
MILCRGGGCHILKLPISENYEKGPRRKKRAGNREVWCFLFEYEPVATYPVNPPLEIVNHVFIRMTWKSSKTSLFLQHGEKR